MTRYGVLGRGRAARSLAPLVARLPYATLAWWWSLGDDGDPGALDPVDVVLLAVPDAEIEAAAASLAERPGAHDEIWLHLSGSRPGLVARVYAEVPRAAGCLHPLVALTGDPDPARLAGAVAGVDGDPAAADHAVALASALGMAPQRLGSARKALYHAGAVTVAGHATALFAQAMAMLEAAGFAPDAARRALVPLLRSAVDNLAEAPPADVITGPITRGDAATVAAHLRALEDLGDDDVLNTYRHLARQALALSARRLDPAAHDAIAALLTQP